MWRTLATERAVPLASVCSVAALFWTADQDDLLRPYAEAYLKLVPTIHRGGGVPARTFTSTLPQFGIDLTFVERAEALAVNAVPVVPANLLERADRVRRMLLSRG